MRRKVWLWFTLAALFLSVILLSGCAASPPSKLEAATIGAIERHVTVGGSKDRNLFYATPVNIAAGEQQFQNYCTSCHGPDGRNTGVIFADKMSPPVPLLSSPQVQQFSDGQLHWIIANGIKPSGMPAWKDTLTDQDMWKIVLFIRHLPQPPSAR